MIKLINGIIEFRRTARENYLKNYSSLVAGQSPDALFIACSDSRVVPNTFASTNPGDLFVLRNVGNLVPPCNAKGFSVADESEVAAIEFSVQALKVADIVVCGHSECGAMRAIIEEVDTHHMPHFKSWLRHAAHSLKGVNHEIIFDKQISPVNQLSQINVLQQMKNIASYPEVKQRIENGNLKIHGWWFDLANADVYEFHQKKKKFSLIE